MDKNIFEYQFQLLRDEIATIHAKITSFDDLAFRVKGWAATLWAGLVGYAVGQGKPEGIALSIPLMVAFWILDASFKTYQQRVRARMGIIEQFLNRASQDSGASLQNAFRESSFGSFLIHDPMCNQTFRISDKDFQQTFSKKVSLVLALFTTNVYLMYVALILASLLIMAYLYLKAA